MKRTFDLILSLVALVILSPVLLVVYILIRLKMPDGSPIFKQQRVVGRYGKLFTMYKFRTMSVGYGGRFVTVAGE